MLYCIINVVHVHKSFGRQESGERPNCGAFRFTAAALRTAAAALHTTAAAFRPTAAAFRSTAAAFRSTAAAPCRCRTVFRSGMHLWATIVRRLSWRKCCGHSAARARNKCGSAADAASECTPGPPYETHFYTPRYMYMRRGMTPPNKKNGGHNIELN